MVLSRRFRGEKQAAVAFALLQQLCTLSICDILLSVYDADVKYKGAWYVIGCHLVVEKVPRFTFVTPRT